MGPEFQLIAQTALPYAEVIVRRLLPNGRREGHEFVACNPTRADRKPGSFRINLRTGRWADFATGDRGGDLISLLAYVRGIRQVEACRALARMLGRAE